MNEYNILQIVITPPVFSHNMEISSTGPERRVANMIEQWEEYGFNIFVAYPKRGRYWEQFNKHAKKVIEFEIGNKFNIFSILHLRKIIKENNIRLVHAQGPASLDLLMTITAKICGIKSLITRPVMLCDQIHYSKLRRKLYELIDQKLTLKLVDKIIVVSQYAEKTLTEYYSMRREKICLIYNGVKNFSLAKKEFKNNYIRIGMVAQLFKPKGWYVFIDTIIELISRGFNVRGVIVGDGELKNDLINYITSKGYRDKFEFKGFISDTKEIYSSFDIFLFTSFREGLSVAILEAMSFKVPIVASDVGAIREQIIDGESGFIVSNHSYNKYAEKVIALITNPDLCKLFAENGKKRQEELFSEKSMFLKHVNIYKSLLK